MAEPLSPRALFERLATAPQADAPVSAEAAASASLVLRYFEMWNTGEGRVADQVLGARYVDHANPDVIGPAAARAIAPRFRRAHPDARMTADVVAAGAEYVAVRSTIKKTHEGRAIEVAGTALFRIDAGRIVEQWSWYPGTKPGRFGLPKRDARPSDGER